MFNETILNFWLIFLTFWLFQIIHAQDGNHFSNNFVQAMTIKFYHAFEITDNYILRGTVVISNPKEQDISIKHDHPLNDYEVNALKKAAANNGLYHLKAVAYKSNEEQTKMATSFIKACSLMESDLSDVLTISLDYFGNMVGISGTTTNLACTPSKLPLKLTNFNTTVKIVQTTLGPAPDTQTYIQTLEQEKAEKVKKEKSDNRSFIAKYWMYIVPLVIFLLLSSASNPEGPGER